MVGGLTPCRQLRPSSRRELCVWVWVCMCVWLNQPPPSLGAWAYGDSSVKGGRGVDLAEILHMIFFLLALPRFSPLFCPNLGGQLPLPPPRPLPRTPMTGGGGALGQG